MRTAVIGYPRVGKDRELKFASEKYFKNEISENELMVRCLVAGLKTMKDKYPEIIIDIIFK